MPETISTPRVDQDWEEIIDSLEAEKCVIFLGSGIYQAPPGQGIERALEQWLEVNKPDHPAIHLYNDDGFLLFRNERRHKRKVIEQIKSFYNQSDRIENGLNG